MDHKACDGKKNEFKKRGTTIDTKFYMRHYKSLLDH